MAHPYKNTGKGGTKTPVKHVNTAGSTDHTHNGKPHPPGFGDYSDGEELIEWHDDLNPVIGGSVPGMFMIPMGLYHRYQDLKKTQPNPDVRVGPQYKFDPAKIEAMKYETPPGAPSEDPEMKI